MGNTITRPPVLTAVPSDTAESPHPLHIEAHGEDRNAAEGGSAPSTRQQAIDHHTAAKPASNTEGFTEPKNDANEKDLKTSALLKEEAARQEKLGILLVQLGVASEEKIFGSKDSEAMRNFKERRIPDLLEIHRSQNHVAVPAGVWSKLWRWLASRPKTAPPITDRDRYHEQQLPPAPVDPFPDSAPKRENTSLSWQVAEGISQQQNAKNETGSPPSTFEDSSSIEKTTSGATRKRSTLPQLTFQPLSDDQVDSLTPVVRQERETVLREEEQIHQLLQSINDTRYRYLVPATDMICEAQVLAVIKCYEEKNAAAQKKRVMMQKKIRNKAAEEDEKKKQVSVVETPIVAFDVLACGKTIDSLKTCTSNMVKAYSAREL